MNFKALLLLCSFFTFSAAALARPLVDSTGVENQNGKKVILHKVDPKDTYYSIARRYGVKPQAVIQFNANTPLQPGNLVKVPTEQPFVQAAANNQPAAQTQAPVSDASGTIIQYKVQQHEYLYGLAKRFGTTVEDIKKLNNLQSNALTPGQTLQIRQGVGTAPVSAPATTPTQPQPSEPQQVVPQNQIPPRNATNPNDTAKRDTTHMGIADSLAMHKAGTKYGLYEKNEHGVATWMDDASLDANKKLILHRTAPIGTVMKITNPMTNRTTFAKVVGRFTDNESTKDVIIVMTKNVAESLGALDKRFRVNISYGVANE
ncbi:LysM peptidoglycan-binding domain-containing protein [Mucilaginibacter sp. RS28]|uniref:LysM peptidoglycan-binding domain-containing protein n=1 Tax=Mucilaginibacter straminoryzae TaxID=2932774 RepID=A0A9X1X2W1_9SPHI|nr:LysM peptidoglycan-binding domain-containing protein [Mucilaginibacter straminoryzae]MCJ8209631.1 LysM peptidoglycan-binding domain-containing protein [Mucilaginibacter straminoryzae]